MALQSDIRTMGAADFLQWMHSTRRTGVALFQKREIVKELFFDQGALVWLSTNDPREHLGQVALREGLIDASRLVELLKLQQRSGVPLGRALIDMQLVNAAQLDELLTEHFINSVRDLFWWEGGQFLFEAELPKIERPPGNIRLEIHHLVLEGTRRLDEWIELSRLFNDPRSRLQPRDKCPETFAAPFEKALLLQVRAGKTLGQIVLEMRVHEYYVLALLKQWRKANWIEIQPPAKPTSPNKPAPATTPLQTQPAEFDRIVLLTGKGHLHEAFKALDNFENPLLARQCLALREELEVKLVHELYERLPKEKMLKSARSENELLEDDACEARALFLVSQLDGKTDVGTVVTSSPMGEYQTLKLLQELLYKGWVVSS